MNPERAEIEGLNGKLLLQTEAPLTITFQNTATPFTCEGQTTVVLRTDGCIAVECLLRCDIALLSGIFQAMNTSLSGRDENGEFCLEGVNFTRQQYESTVEWQLLRGEADRIRLTQRPSATGDPSAFLLLSIQIGLGSAEARLALPTASFSWTRIDPNNHIAPGILTIKHGAGNNSTDRPPAFIDAVSMLLSLATMTTVSLIGVQNPDGTSEYRTTPPIRSRQGFQLVPQYSRSQRREEIVHFLSQTIGVVVQLPEQRRNALRKAILFLVESDYEEYIEFKYLKAYLALITVVRAFAEGDDPTINPSESTFLAGLIDEVRGADLSERFKRLAVSRLNGLLEPNDRDAIDAMLSALGLEQLLPRELTNRIRGSLLHSAIFIGQTLDEKVAACQELSLGVCWIMMKILGFNGVFTHALKDSFHIEINAQTGEETSTR